MTRGVSRLFIGFAREERECRNSPCRGRFSFFRGSIRLFLFVYGLVWTCGQFFGGLLASRWLGTLREGASYPWPSLTFDGFALSRLSDCPGSRNMDLSCHSQSSLDFDSSSFECVFVLILDKTLIGNLAEPGTHHRSQIGIKRNYGPFVTSVVFWSVAPRGSAHSSQC